MRMMCSMAPWSIGAAGTDHCRQFRLGFEIMDIGRTDISIIKYSQAGLFGVDRKPSRIYFNLKIFGLGIAGPTEKRVVTCGSYVSAAARPASISGF
jgi:hypothetical protein